MTVDKAVLCSYSKVRDFDLYFLDYPRSPLKIDLLVDLFLYPKLIINQVAFGTIFSLPSIEKGQWKHAFEDLVNTGAIDVMTDYPSREEEFNLLKASSNGKLPYQDSALDLALLTMYSQKREVPLIYSKKDVGLFEPAERVIDTISDCPDPPYMKELDENDLKSKAVIWTLEIVIPKLFTDRSDRKKAVLMQDERIDDFVFISPDELAGLLKDQKAISQLREHILNLASLDPSKKKIQDHIVKQRRLLREKLNKAGTIFDFIDLGISFVPIPWPFSTICSLLGKGSQKLITYQISKPYRWLFFTEEINSRIAA